VFIPYTSSPYILDSHELTTKFQGMTIVIETPKGEIRYGKGWSHKMPADYGYIEETVGADGDEMDCYLGPDLKSETAFIVDQNQKDNSSEFDEHKVMLGYFTEAAAAKDYIAGHTHGEEIFRGITAISMPDLKRWLKTGDVSKPVSD